MIPSLLVAFRPPGGEAHEREDDAERVELQDRQMPQFRHSLDDQLTRRKREDLSENREARITANNSRRLAGARFEVRAHPAPCAAG